MRERLNFWDFVFAVLIPVFMIFGMAMSAFTLVMWLW